MEVPHFFPLSFQDCGSTKKFVVELRFTEGPVHPSGWQRVYQPVTLKPDSDNKIKVLKPDPIWS